MFSSAACTLPDWLTVPSAIWWLVLIAFTAAPTPPCSLAIICSISSVDCWVRLARVRTSSATTAKPRPCSPARAASMAALSASRLVCSAMPLITSSTRLIEALSEASWLITDTDSSISPARRWMLPTCCSTRARPLAVSSFTLCALPTAATALRATSWAVADISFIAVATCSIWSRWPATAWLLSVDTDSTRTVCRSTSATVRPTRLIRSWIFTTVSLKAWPSSPSSSRLCTLKLTVMSPPATFSITRPSCSRVVRVDT
ncbi:hypothetical protein D9M68_414460 [compost metagenome]